MCRSKAPRANKAGEEDWNLVRALSTTAVQQRSVRHPPRQQWVIYRSTTADWGRPNVHVFVLTNCSNLVSAHILRP
jgi:hypothetical protein